MQQPHAQQLTINAFAKVNLALAVGPPEPPSAAKPGWHRICSWFAPIALHDELALTRLGDDSPSRYTITWAEDAPRPSPIDWPIEKDLAVRAHRALEKHAGRALPVSLEMRKRIPVGGGLGGGSSDAAAMLRGVNALFQLGLTTQQLQALGSPLGSDVAFFIDDDREALEGDDAEETEDAAEIIDLTHAPRPAVVSGFGETILRVETPTEDLLLLIPPFGCPTPAVYKAFDAAPTAAVNESRVMALVKAAGDDGELPVMDLFNDLTPPACAVEPRLQQIIDSAAAPTAIPVYLTGSGSTLFIPFHAPDDEDAINRLADLVEQNIGPKGEIEPLGVIVVPTRIV